MGVDDVTKTAKDAGRQAESSTALDRAVRVGLSSYGVVHLLLAWLMLQLALGSRNADVSTSGALRALAGGTAGRGLLVILGAGFAALVLWQLLETFVGHRSQQGVQRALRRAVSLGRAVMYGALGVSAVKIALGSSSSGTQTRPDTLSARLMDMPYGSVLVAAVGVAAIGYAVGTVYWALSRRFEENLESRGVVGARGKAIGAFAKVGYTARAVGFLLVGLLFVWAAATRDPERSGGLDEALARLLEQPFGPAALVIVAAGFTCFGLYCFAWARHLSR
ncbi:DUF1206 domain-containing protein [Ruania zhangjianzhongii]|uniref:DUF1206 domain-containing protein n=1 Tax=Ruania zhangjianzhongii TaxID=2603206 RepID=UPI0011CCAD71|nr:DUF1206 domain-containing protein [Ruania zhangjianzhongii]